MIIIKLYAFIGLATLGIELDSGVRLREYPYWKQNNNLLTNQIGWDTVLLLIFLEKLTSVLRIINYLSSES